MGLKLYEETSVQAIANAIRAKNGSSDTYTISEMSTAIAEIPSGGGGEEKTKVVTDDIALVSQNGSSVNWHEDGSVDLTWLGGTGIGFNYVGLCPIKDAKRVLVHIDELGESYQHKYSTEQRNWNFTVGLTNEALPLNYVDLPTIDSQGKLVTDVEVDVIANYGKTDLNYVIDLSSYQNQDLYLFIMASGMTIEGLKVTIVYDNAPSRMRYTGYNRLFIEGGMGFQFDPNGKFKTIWISPGSSIGCTLQGVRDLNGVITSVHVTGSITDSYEYAYKTGYDRCQFVVGFTDQRKDSIIYVGYNVNPYIKEEITLTNQQEVNNIDILIDLTDSQYEQYASTPKYFFISLLGISGEFEVTLE